MTNIKLSITCHQSKAIYGAGYDSSKVDKHYITQIITKSVYEHLELNPNITDIHLPIHNGLPLAIARTIIEFKEMYGYPNLHIYTGTHSSTLLNDRDSILYAHAEQAATTNTFVSMGKPYELNTMAIEASNMSWIMQARTAHIPIVKFLTDNAQENKLLYVTDLRNPEEDYKLTGSMSKKNPKYKPLKFVPFRFRNVELTETEELVRGYSGGM